MHAGSSSRVAANEIANVRLVSVPNHATGRNVASESMENPAMATRLVQRMGEPMEFKVDVVLLSNEESVCCRYRAM